MLRNHCLSLVAFTAIIAIGIAQDRLLTAPRVIKYDCAQFSPDGRFVAARCSWPRNGAYALAIWDTKSHKLVTWQPIKGGVGCFQFSPKSDRIVLFSYDQKTAAFFRRKRTSEGDDWILQAELQRQKHPTSRMMGLHSAAFSEDGEVVACTSARPKHEPFPSRQQPGEIEIWDVSRQKVIQRIPVPVSFPFPIAIQNRELIYTTGSMIHRGDLASESVVASRSIRDFQSSKPIGSGSATGTDLSPDGKSIAICGGGFLVELDAKTFELQRQFEFSDESFSSCVHYTPDGKHLIHGESFHHIRILDVATGKLVSQHPFRSVRSLDVSPDGRTIALTSMVDGDGVHLWDLKKLLP